MDQRTSEWFQARLGHVTASGVKHVMAKVKTGEAAARRDYRTQLVCERITGLPTETYQNADMARGVELEPQAREAYEMRSGVLWAEVGFIKHPRLPWCGASPDGINGDVGLEIKCPRPANHIAMLRSSEIPSEYLPQLAFQAACGGFSAVQFISYCPAMPEGLQLFMGRWFRDDKLIAGIEEEVEKFLAEVEADVEALRKLAA